MDPEATLEFKLDADLDGVIANYLNAAQAGAAPTPETLIARYPAFASALAGFLGGQEQLRRLAEPAWRAVADVASVGMKVRYFGDYELLEEIARGGMGVVYRARQVSLDRPVALKMILARPVGRFEKLAKWARRRPAIASLSSAVIVIGLVGLSGILWQWREAVAARINAQEQAGIAKDQSRIAAEQARIALQNENAARKEAEFANRRLYDVKMNVVQRSWEDWNPTLFLATLNEQLPEHQRGIERRGFEWFYWQRKTSSGHITLKGQTGQVNSVAFSPNGRWVASASQDGTVKVWDAATGLEIRTLKGHSDPVTCVAFDPDGKRLATTGWDSTVKVWDTATGLEIRTLKGHTQGVWSVAFSPDGHRLASASQDMTVKVWDARPLNAKPAKPGPTFR